MSKLHGRSVIVQDGNVDKGLRKFKKKIQSTGILLELRDREHYIKPTTRRKLKKNAAQGRWRKYLKDQALPPRQY